MKFDDVMKFLKLEDKNKRNKYLIIIGLIGIVLIFVSGFFPKAEKDVKKTEESKGIYEYSEQLKKELEDTISNIDRAGKAEVFLTFERGYEYIYAKTDKKSEDKSESSKTNEYSADEKSSGEEEYIIVNTEDGEKPLIVTEIEPKVKGVVIVCKGGDSQDVVTRIKSSVSISLGIPESKICVVPKSK